MDQSEFMERVRYLAKECGVSEDIARIALTHSRGSIGYAKELLAIEQCRFAFGREAREYHK